MTQRKTIFIAITYHAYGVGDTAEEAMKNCRFHGGSSTVKLHGMVVYRTDSDSTISAVDGSINYPLDGFKPMKVRDTRPKMRPKE
jgi:hypothetical protein